MNARSRLVVWLFTALAVIVILAVALAPTVLSWRLRTAVARSFAGSPQVSVQVNAPPWAIVTGALDALNLNVRRAIAGRLAIEQLSLRLEDVKVDPGRLLRGDASAITRVGRGEGEVTLAQEDVQTFLASAKGVRRAVLRLDAGVITIEGDVRLGAVDLRVRMEGRLVVASPTTVDLYVQTLTVSGVQIPREIGSVLVSSLNPLITLDGMPVPMRIESVAVEGGQVRLSVRIGETS